MLVALVRHLLDDGHAKTKLVTQLGHGCGAALAALAEMEVIAHHNVAHGEPLDEVHPHELFRRKFRERVVEIQHRHE